MRERFIVGAGGDNPTVAGGEYLVSAVGGANEITLNENQLGAHTHITDEVDLSHTHPSELEIEDAEAFHNHPANTATGGGTHNHSAGISGGGGHSHGTNGGDRGGGSNNGPGAFVSTGNSNRASITGAGNHNHGVNITNDQGSHTHDLDVVGAAATHTHDFTLTVEGIPLFHNHQVFPSGTTPQTGDADPHENRPPYYALCYIIQFK